jgi:RNA polymerase primary sigma factor
MPLRRRAPQPFATYLREINGTPLLTAAEERELARAVQRGQAEARDHLVRANLRLVVRLARGYQGKGLPLEDLIAEGNLGLLRAAEDYDPARGTRFSTYATHWVRQCIARALVNSARTVRVPAYMAQLLSEWRRAAAQLQEELGRTPTEEEVAGRLGLSQRRVRLVQSAMRAHGAGREVEVPGALDGLPGGDRSRPPEAGAMAAEEMREALALLEHLGGREATVLRLRFGLDGQDPLVLQEIGQRLGVTRERARQIEKQALKNLRGLLDQG